MNDCKIGPIFFLSSHSLQAMIVNKGYSLQSSAIFRVTLVVSSKNTRIRHSVQEKSNLFLFVFVSRVNETMRWCHKVNWTHSPALSCIGQKSAQLPWFERVQYLKETPRAKNIFVTVIRAVATIYVKIILEVSGTSILRLLLQLIKIDYCQIRIVWWYSHRRKTFLPWCKGHLSFITVVIKRKLLKMWDAGNFSLFKRFSSDNYARKDWCVWE